MVTATEATERRRYRAVGRVGRQPSRSTAGPARGDRTAAVGPAREVRVPADTEAADGRGKSAVRGFIDSSMHGSGQEDIDR